MIRKLRRKFIFVASAAVLLVIMLVLISATGISYYSNYSDIMSILNFITDNNGRMPSEKPSKNEVGFHITPEMAYETRYFSIIINSDEEIVTTDYDHISAVGEGDIGVFYETFINDRDGVGSLETDGGMYFYRSKEVSGESLLSTYEYDKRDDSDEGMFDDDGQYRIIVFLDCTNRMYNMGKMCVFSILAGLMCFVIFFILLSVLSKRAIKPAIESYEKQKQFITNAGHELKTPLAIISANAEVIEAVEGSNEWTRSILNQVKRLSGLVNKLITLARMEEYAEKEEMLLEEIDFSAKVKEVADSFVPLARQNNKTLLSDIADDIKLNGNEKAIHELVSILIDNAVKYCTDGGEIRVALEKHKKQAALIVSNPSANENGIDFARFFDRFYRGDTSHNREKADGYGIGLSMAQRIVQLHKGKISAAGDNGNISFTVTLPSER